MATIINFYRESRDLSMAESRRVTTAWEELLLTVFMVPQGDRFTAWVLVDESRYYMMGISTIMGMHEFLAMTSPPGRVSFEVVTPGKPTRHFVVPSDTDGAQAVTQEFVWFCSQECGVRLDVDFDDEGNMV
jgi:hypothetical protein